ncbi:hypothetical protein [Moorena sp. SIO3H5]|uniref:hypothetical protein n=1 Tax=Moorena sp. SIO3H5 TaxID=2607834 RepID=UPI0013BDC5AD|nr:hypothetical protein [Moorena sp. SIO3H5]NEO72387.1 hypothetical protein [Moorena sp. SIO3H5]
MIAMQMRWEKLFSVVVIAATASLGAGAAIAETNSEDLELIPLVTLPEAFENAFFNDSGDFFENRSIKSQIDTIFGSGWPPAFPELALERDAERVINLYRDVLEQQVSSGPVIRTLDLPNPYNTSLRLLEQSSDIPIQVENQEFFLAPQPLPQLRR